MSFIIFKKKTFFGKVTADKIMNIYIYVIPDISKLFHKFKSI